MLLHDLEKKKIIQPPEWLASNTMFLVLMGSQAYGTSHEDSDFDMYGFCIPKREVVFPHLAGKLVGFDTDLGTWEGWQQHHCFDRDALGGKGREYDFHIYSIVKYFVLLSENNPNLVDSLFVPFNCIVHNTQVGNMVREKRKIFLHKGAYHRFKQYAYSQLHKMSTKEPEKGSKREEIRKKFGFDVKFAVHLVRLVLECEQLLTEGDLDLQRNNEQLKAILRGEWTEKQIKDFFTQKEKHLESLKDSGPLPYSPDMGRIKQLLFDCLETHYGSLEKCVVQPDKAAQVLAEVKAVLERNNI